MLKNDTLVERIKTITTYYKLTPSEFADKIGINRATFSHINSGRNKPSLEVILKIVNCFTDVNYDWLLEGKGIFPAQKSEKQSLLNFTTENNTKKTEEKSEPKNKAVEQIIICYADGTFKIYR